MSWDLLQWPGALLGLIGAILVAGSSPAWRRWGFAIWLGSNALLMGWSLWSHAWGLLGMYVFYFVTSAIGLWNNRRRCSAQVVRGDATSSPLDASSTHHQERDG